jgi:ubiquitin-like-conjugating enzyme ATG3
VTAGDYLVYKFPTWSWEGAPEPKRRDFLPPEKQVLVTRHVPSHVRAEAFGRVEDTITEEDGDEWVAAGGRPVEASSSSIGDHHEQDIAGNIENDRHAEEEILDIDEMEEDLEDDAGVFTNSMGSNVTRTPERTYNLYITYSTSYRVPKFYLSGFNGDGSPLSPQEMFEDIMGDYKDKTVTIEKAPFQENLTLISIHPCRHANVMKILLDRAEARLRAKEDLNDVSTEGVAKAGLAPETSEDASDEWEEIAKNDTHDPSQNALRVDQYLVIFLKFIASVTPGIEHDFTMSAL